MKESHYINIVVIVLFSHLRNLNTLSYKSHFLPGTLLHTPKDAIDQLERFSVECR